ncbi:MAG: hypothetical protein IE933_04335 [Sphingomonadales bacterium]|nr:hypothetical protein [Sphingomonadales bacterium]MBD3772821.1 hypothetical protein [Paracoccaceae bacterium]
MRKLLAALAALAILAAVAVPTGLADPLIRYRVHAALVEGGMSDQRADCMAGRMVKRLSLWQLYKLHRAMAPLAGESEQPGGIGETIKRLRRGTDTETVAVVTTSAGLCAAGIG